jgi:hypothetical protein
VSVAGDQKSRAATGIPVGTESPKLIGARSPFATTNPENH